MLLLNDRILVHFKVTRRLDYCNSNVSSDFLSRTSDDLVFEGIGLRDGMEFLAVVLYLWLLSIVELCQSRGLVFLFYKILVIVILWLGFLRAM